MVARPSSLLCTADGLHRTLEPLARRSAVFHVSLCGCKILCRIWGGSVHDVCMHDVCMHDVSTNLANSDIHVLGPHEWVALAAIPTNPLPPQTN
jgi:hypothetical protein